MENPTDVVVGQHQLQTEHNQENNTKISKPVVKCEICGLSDARYRCPGCHMQTCSVSCVKQHKQISGCTGQRDKTSYVPIREFTETHLLSDYRFLEEAGRKVDIASKDARRFHSKSRPIRVTTFLKHARQRGVDLRLMPYPMTKRKINTSIYQYASKSVHWRVEWVFPHEQLTFIDKGFKDSQLLTEGVERHIQAYLQSHTSSCLQASNAVQIHPDLSLYTEEGGHSYHILMKVEGLPGKKERFYKMDIDKSLCDNLCGKRVIEFPRLLVIPVHLANTYLILSKEEETELQKPPHLQQQHITSQCLRPRYTEEEIFDPNSSIYSA